MLFSNPFKWTPDQWKAASRHVITSTGTALAILIWFKLIPDVNAKEVADNVNILVESLTKAAIAIGAIVTALGPIWAMFKASQSAAPEHQAEATIKNLEEGRPIDGKKSELINAIANDPEVKKVEMMDKSKANEIPNPKVT